MFRSLLLLALITWSARAWVPSISQRSRPSLLMSSSTTEDSAGAVTTKGLLKRDGYVATNRFAVRAGQAAKFERRWATRKSRLATLEGFRYFMLMRRVKIQDDGSVLYDEGDTAETAQDNYVSFTIWNRKSDFSAWRSGEAFKEAHGGTSIGAFLSTMVSSAMVLRGPPRPAFYDGLLLQTSSSPSSSFETVDGWRNVEADGVNTLPAECFVEMTKLFVPLDSASNFEQAYKETKMPTVEGVIASSLMRRDGQAKGHGTVPLQEGEATYVRATIFEDRASFEKWLSENADDGTEKLPGQARPAEMVLYEGTLVINST